MQRHEEISGKSSHGQHKTFPVMTMCRKAIRAKYERVFYDGEGSLVLYIFMSSKTSIQDSLQNIVTTK